MKLSSANSFNLGASKICRFGKGKLTSISQFVPILYSSSTNVLNLSKTICEFVVWERVNMKKLIPCTTQHNFRLAFEAEGF